MKTLTIVRSEAARFGNTVNKTTTATEINGGTIAIHARNPNGGEDYWRTFDTDSITGFVCADAPDGLGRQVTVSYWQPDVPRSVTLLLARTKDVTEGGQRGGGELVASAATNRASATQSYCGTHAESLDINHATGITLV